MVSLGCPKNLVDGEVMLGRLQQAGHEVVADPGSADVIVVNTCAFIDRAKQESVDAILEMARQKEVGRARRLVVTGCMAQRYDAELRAEIPEIDATLGTGQVEDVVRAVGGESTSLEEAPGAPSWVYDHTAPRVLSTPPWLAYLKISEGCDYTCSFCIIPTLRGRHRSRTVEDIVAEARALAGRGVRELVLVAQDSTRYGLDHGIRDGLAYLLRRLAEDRRDPLDPGDVRLSPDPHRPDPRRDRLRGEGRQLRRHPPAARLGGHAEADEASHREGPPPGDDRADPRARPRRRDPDLVHRGLPRARPRPSFEELLEFVRAARFDNVGVFTYSHEEGTTAHELGDPVPAEVKEERRERLMALQGELSAEPKRGSGGGEAGGPGGGDPPGHRPAAPGRFAGQAPEIDGQVIINDGTAEAGEFVTVEVTEAHPYDLVGRLV